MRQPQPHRPNLGKWLWNTNNSEIVSPCIGKKRVSVFNRIQIYVEQCSCCNVAVKYHGIVKYCKYPGMFFFTVLGMIELHGVTYKEVTGVVHKDDNVISIH